MFPSASIAFTFLVIVSGIAVRSAPLVPRAASGSPLACTELNGGGTCFPLLTNPNFAGRAECNNIVGVKSVILSGDDDCDTFATTNCSADVVEAELTSLTDNNIPDNIKSIECGV
ncbi:hypothetical protein DFH09DRAFT_1369697 [Mycena vulgaris]|nr:hypothetical protein DFH09DRAFT_1369697 [Mycena vulgaris]